MHIFGCIYAYFFAKCLVVFKLCVICAIKYRQNDHEKRTMNSLLYYLL